MFPNDLITTVMENPTLIFMGLGAIVSCLLVLMVFVLMRSNSLLRKNLRAVDAHNQGLREAIQSLVARTEQFGEEYRRLQTDLALKGLYQDASDAYLQAINAAKSGASADHIADNFGLIKSEAELLVAIHGVQDTVAEPR